jgi:hypothetical protein
VEKKEIDSNEITMNIEKECMSAAYIALEEK